MERSFSEEKLLALIEDTDKETVLMVAEMVEESFDENIAAVKSFLEKDDKHGAARKIHTMKSSIASLGGTKFWEIADALENKLDNQDIPACQNEITKFFEVSAEFGDIGLKEIKAFLED